VQLASNISYISYKYIHTSCNYNQVVRTLRLYNTILRCKYKRKQQATGRNAYFNLFQSRSLEPEIIAVVAEAADFRMVPVVAHANNWNLALLYQLYQLLQHKSLHGTVSMSCCSCTEQITNCETLDTFTSKLAFSTTTCPSQPLMHLRLWS